DALGKGLQSMITTDLATLQTLKVVERARLKDVQAELKLSRAAAFDKETAAKLGKLSGASHLFVGSYTVLGETMRLDGRLLSVASGQVLLAEQISGEKALFFELEQQLVQKVIAALGIKVAPKEKAVLARPHTADFGALRKFSEGIQAFDDGRLEQALKALNEAKTIDADFKLAALTLAEYERLAAEVRAKAELAGKAEAELDRLEKNQAIAAEVGLLKKLWALVDATKGSAPAAKLKRVAALCALSDAYASAFGFRSRGPVGYSDLAAAGFDSFTLARTSDALFKRAWAEAADLFPKLPPLCIGINSLSASNPRPVDELLGYHIKDAQELSARTDVLLSYMSNNARVDPAAEKLQLDTAGTTALWEKLYALAQKLPDLTDDDRARYEKYIAEWRRRAGDFDGSTQMWAAASRHTKDSYQLKQLAKEIEANKQLKLLVGTAPTPLRELYLLEPGTHISDLERTAKGDAAKLREKLERAREVSERNGWVMFGGTPMWRFSRSNYATFRSGPRVGDMRAEELRYDGRPNDRGFNSESPLILASALRSAQVKVSASVYQGAPPADFVRFKQDLAGNGEVGVGFGLKRLAPEGSIERDAPLVTVGFAVLLVGDKAKLVRITRDGEHNVRLQPLSEAKITPPRTKQKFELKLESGSVALTLGSERVSLPLKATPSELDGYVGFVFRGSGYASVSEPRIQVGDN
ncbi:MAG TPA: CsgG/HfaB family protein, partial [Polyangiales bacterium]